MPNQNQLKPCLVLGTGFHNYVLGDSLGRYAKPLICWNELILAAAKELGVALNDTKHNLPLHWERLLSCGFENEKTARSQSVAKAKDHVARFEKQAQMAAALVLRDLQAKYPASSRKARFPEGKHWGAVVSLNYDSHWLDAQAKWAVHKGNDQIACVMDFPISENEQKRLNRHMMVCKHGANKRIWFPNGHVSLAESMRLGLRDYGFQSVAISHAFNAIKEFERKAGSYSQYLPFVSRVLQGEATLDSFTEAPNPVPLNWVTEMLYRPVFFAGAGMSDAETGLWWLMVQRARNLAKVPARERPGAFILLRDDNKRMDFWKTRPCDIEPIICSSWEQGWEMLQNKALEIAGV